MDQAQNLLKNQQPTILKDPFPQGQNATLVSNVAGGTTNSPEQNYINMDRTKTLLHIINKNYETKTLEKGKSIGETSNPLTIEKPVEPMPKIPKGVFKKALHNPNARAAANYFVVEDLSQTPCVMSALEVLQSCPTQ